MGQVQAAIGDLQKAYQAGAAAQGASSPNPVFLGSLLDGFAALFAPNYQSPRSVQMNIGIQRELHPGTILSVDLLRNVATHYLLGSDTNHVGSAQYLNITAANNAIAKTTAGACGGTSTPAAIDCAIANGATIATFAGNGLDSGGTMFGGLGP